MTEQELDLFMRNVLLDAIALDEETNTETIPYTPSLHHQKQIKANIQFTIQARLSTDDLLHMAESVSLDNLPEIE